MTKQLLFNEEARRKIQEGIDVVANAVKVTLGPKGRNVILDQEYGQPHITKDGVSVAKEIELKDRYQNVGVKLIKSVANKTVNDVGDAPQPLTAKILTPKGWVCMGDLSIGDEICGTNKTIQKVIGIYPQKQLKEIYKVHFHNGRIVECCEDHLWSINTKRTKKLKTIQLKELIGKEFKIDKDGNKQYQYFIPPTIVDFHKQKQTLDPYLVGLLLCDGSLTGTGSIELSLALNKEYVLKKLILPDNIQFKATIDSDKKHYIRVKFSRITPEGKTMFDYVKELGLLGVNSHNKFIPKNYLYSSYEDRLKLLEGFIDSDCYINSRGLLEYSTVSKQLFNDYCELMWSLGRQVSINSFNMKDRGIGYCSDSILYRAYEIKGFKQGIRLEKIEKTGKFVEMQCIKVSNEDELYITNDYICTHNTTTSTVLTQAIIKEGLKNVTAGANPMDLKKGIDLAVGEVVKYIKEIATPVDDKIAQVATISANNDEEIGNLIADAVNKVGRDGIITVEESNGTETYIKVNEGIQFNTGFLSPYFITDRDKSTCVLENPRVLLYDAKMSTLKEFYEVLEQVMNRKESILIVASDYDSEVLDTLVLNKIKAGFKVCVVKTPRLNKAELTEDISAVTGAMILNDTFEKVLPGHFGSAEKIVVDKHTTTIINGRGDILTQHITHLKEKEQLERASKLEGGIATLYIGANSEVELKEKKDRIEDALCATKAAIEEGIVPGGGSVYVRAFDRIYKLRDENPDINTGINIIKNALAYPIKQICANAGVSGDVIFNNIIDNTALEALHNSARVHVEELDNYGYNAKTGVFGNMLKMGVIDPAKAVRVALENAASVAGLFLTTECVIVDDIE